MFGAIPGVPGEGLEPTRIAPEDFKSSASASSATPACCSLYYAAGQASTMRNPRETQHHGQCGWKKRGDERIRTADGGFADPCLAAWLRRRTHVRQPIAYRVQA